MFVQEALLCGAGGCVRCVCGVYAEGIWEAGLFVMARGCRECWAGLDGGGAISISKIKNINN
jgi:hypothetical protein